MIIYAIAIFLQLGVSEQPAKMFNRITANFLAINMPLRQTFYYEVPDRKILSPHIDDISDVA